MGFISKQWLKGNKQRNRSHIPVPVTISAQKGDYLESKVTLTTTWLNGLDEEEYKDVDLTKEEVEQALPYFLRESDLTDLPLDDPKRVAVIAALSQLSDAELLLMLRDILVAKAEPEPPSRLNVADFATALGVPYSLLLEQLQASGVSKKQESDSISEQDKTQLLAHLRIAQNAKQIAKGEHNMKMPTEATTDAEDKILLGEGVRLGRMLKENYLLEVRQGTRESNFNELRQLEMDIEKCEKELGRMK